MFLETIRGVHGRLRRPDCPGHHYGDNQDHQIQAGDGQVGIHQPRVHQRGQRQEQESQERNQQAVVGALDITGEKEQQRERDARERQKK